MFFWEEAVRVVNGVGNNKGCGLVTNLDICEGTALFEEQPVVHLQHSANRLVAPCCACCGRWIASVEELLRRAFSEDPEVLARLESEIPDWPAHIRDELKQTAKVDAVHCSSGCGEIYCSVECRQNDYRTSHRLLCVGQSDEMTSPLYKLKMLSMETSDNILLAAKLLVTLGCQAAESIECQNENELSQKVKEKCQHFISNFCLADWLSTLSRHSNDEDERESLLISEQTLLTAFRLLQETLVPSHPSIFQLLLYEPSVFSHSLGLLELNAIDIEIASPLEKAFTCPLQGVVWPAFHGVGFFRSVSMLNHSCRPNIELNFDSTTKVGLVTKMNVAADSLLTFSYLDEDDLMDDNVGMRREHLQNAFGFWCMCERCVEGETQLADRLHSPLAA